MIWWARCPYTVLEGERWGPERRDSATLLASKMGWGHGPRIAVVSGSVRREGSIVPGASGRSRSCWHLDLSLVRPALDG